MIHVEQNQKTKKQKKQTNGRPQSQKNKKQKNIDQWETPKPKKQKKTHSSVSCPFTLGSPIGLCFLVLGSPKNQKNKNKKRTLICLLSFHLGVSYWSFFVFFGGFLFFLFFGFLFFWFFGFGFSSWYFFWGFLVFCFFGFL